MADNTSGFTRPYVESSVFFAHVKQEHDIASGGLERCQITEYIFESAARKQYQILTSAVTIAEVRRLKKKAVQLDQNELAIVRKMFHHDWIVIVDITLEVAELAQELGNQYGIDPMDSIHLASAITWNCDVFLTWDGPLMHAVVDNPCRGVALKEPFFRGQLNLPHSSDPANRRLLPPTDHDGAGT